MFPCSRTAMTERGKAKEKRRRGRVACLTFTLTVKQLQSLGALKPLLWRLPIEVFFLSSLLTVTLVESVDGQSSCTSYFCQR